MDETRDRPIASEAGTPQERGRLADAAELRRRLPTSGPLYALGAIENPAFGQAEAMALLRNRSLHPDLISTLLGSGRIAPRGDALLAVVRHPGTPVRFARMLLATLPWTALAQIALDGRTPAVLRRDAEETLRQRIRGLSTGERIALARRAPSGVVRDLRRGADARVLGALLENPRLPVGEAADLASDPATPREILARLGERSPWCDRQEIRRAIVGNPRTPVPVALRLLRGMREAELAHLTGDADTPRIVRVGAARRLAERAP